jgi:hypothetical protein
MRSSLFVLAWYPQNVSVKVLEIYNAADSMNGYACSMHPQSIRSFWFEELTPKQQFVKDAALDETIRTRFGDTLEAAAWWELFV